MNPNKHDSSRYFCYSGWIYVYIRMHQVVCFQQIKIVFQINESLCFKFIFQVPRVFVNGEFIGGGTDVKKMKENGKLSILLNACR